MVCKEVWNFQIFFIFLIFFTIYGLNQILGLSQFDPFIESSHFDVTNFGLYFLREICQNLEEGQKNNNNQNFSRKFWLISEVIDKQKKKN